MARYFWSDGHFGHENIIEYSGRPFASVDEMNEALVDNWNATVGVNDTVYVLGDVVMGKIADTLPLISLLNGYKILLPGNHDRPWEGNPEKRRKGWTEKYLDAGFAEILNGTNALILGGEVPVIMNHFPYTGDSQAEERHLEWRPRDMGYQLLHGHVHEAWKINGRMHNVGVDVRDFKPVSEDELVEEIRETWRNE